MFLIEQKIVEILKSVGKKLLPSEAYVLTYFRRDSVYLQSSYVLAAMGFIWPSMNLQRTVYETILRGYLFIVDARAALCESAHPGTKGILLDFPAYTEKEIEDSLNVLLMLSYGNIQMVAETFWDRINEDAKAVVRTTLNTIAVSVGKLIPSFEPDRECYTSNLRLQKGNFMDVI